MTTHLWRSRSPGWSWSVGCRLSAGCWVLGSHCIACMLACARALRASHRSIAMHPPPSSHASNKPIHPPPPRRGREGARAQGSEGASALPGMQQVAVLANENPGGLLLAARLALYSGGRFAVRCSVGGRLGRLLEPGWGLVAQDERGRRVRIRTAVVDGRDAVGRVLHPVLGDEIVLWLCDWKDSNATWYALANCQIIIQTSKAVDSKTVAMWLVEVCAEDAVVISLQSGLHNVRELREVFGRKSKEEVQNSARLMPLFSIKPKTRAASDDVSSSRSRSDSQASFLEELENELDEDQRTQSPAPPHAKRNSVLSVGTITPNSSFNNLQNLTSSSPRPSVDSAAGAASPSAAGARSSPTAQLQMQTGLSAAATGETPESDLPKPGVLILAGVLGFQSSAMVDEPTKTIRTFLTTDAAMVIERLSRDKEKRALQPVAVLECARFYIKWRPALELNNWLWGDLVWRTFDAYGAALHLIAQQPVSGSTSTTATNASFPSPSTAKGRSLYALLADSDPTHRRVYAALIDEALLALQWQKVELMDPATSPLFGLGFRRARAFLLLPQGVFRPVMRLLMLLTQTNVVRDDSPFGDVSVMHKYMAAFLNGEVVRIGFESDVLTPVNQELMEALSSSSSLPTNQGEDRLVKTPLPPLLSWGVVLTVASSVVALLAVMVRFVAFVYEVVVEW